MLLLHKVNNFYEGENKKRDFLFFKESLGSFSPNVVGTHHVVP